MNKKEMGQDVLIVEGRMAQGYGIVPKMVMKDRRLTIEAKAIYSYFCSYAGAGNSAFPSRNRITADLQIGKDRFYRHFHLLKEYGYITVEQSADNTGKFRNNIYTLVEKIETPLKNPPKNPGPAPGPHFNDTEDKNPCHCFADTDDADTDGGDAKNNSIVKNNNTKNNHSTAGNGSKKKKNKIITKVQSQSQGQSQNQGQDQKAKLSTVADIKSDIKLKPDKTMTIDNDTESTRTSISKKEEVLSPIVEPHSPKPAENTPQIPVQDNFITYREIIQENINYDEYIRFHAEDKALVDEIINCMLDVICSEGRTVKINGELKVREMVKSQYLKLTSEDIEHVIYRFKKQSHKIVRLHAYLKTMLYTVRQEFDHYHTNAVRANGNVW